MSFTATCPYCGAAYPDMADGHRGRRARCNRCNQAFLVVPPDDRAPEARARARQLKVPFVRVAAIPLDPAVAARLPRALLERHVAVPVGHHGDEVIVAMANPLDVLALDDLRRHCPRVRPALGLADEIEHALATLPSPDQVKSEEEARRLQAAGGSAAAAAALQELERQQGQGAGGTATAVAAPAGDRSPAQAAVDQLLEGALAVGAVELRVMPQDGQILVQARVQDGSLKAVPVETAVPYHNLIARLKDDAGCDPTRRGVEQTGAIPFTHAGKTYEFLLRILPARDAERAQLRVLDAATMRQRRAIERRQQIDATLAELASEQWPPAGRGIDPTSAKEFVVDEPQTEQPVIQLVYAMLLHGLETGARDLVIEPAGEQSRVLTRGAEEHFEEAMIIPDYAQKPVLARLQIMANIDLAYAQQAHQGVFYVLRGGQAREVRVATLPTDIGLMALLHFVGHTGKSQRGIQ